MIDTEINGEVNIEIKIGNNAPQEFQVTFVTKDTLLEDDVYAFADKIFDGEYLSSVFVPVQPDLLWLLIGLGDGKTGIKEVKETTAKAVRIMKDKKITAFSMDISRFIVDRGRMGIREVVEGIYLGAYEQPFFGRKDRRVIRVSLVGIPEEDRLAGYDEVLKGERIAQGIIWARDLVNMPGNYLKPDDFAKQVMGKLTGLGVDCELVSHEQLKGMKMGGLLAVGESSVNPPCLLICRYLADPGSSEVIGIVGKGVTCDTGGYCLKGADAMMGIKGDMAGGAAVAGAIGALAANKVKTNVIGLIPMCENRIAPGSMVPGDVITSYSGKTIEICNTDAEGRLILADAVSYGVTQERVTRVLDIATLTGAVVNMLGFTTAGLVSDSQEFYEHFRKAYEFSGERYWRLPIYEEQEEMMKSKIADIKNMGERHCATITAALFIKAFAEGIPWIHLDIAGTAWVDRPRFEYQSNGATGAGVSSLYYLCALLYGRE